MATTRSKKYTMRAIPSKFSEKGGFAAHFEADGYTVDAFKEILPGVISENGLKLSDGTAADLIRKFLQKCVLHTAVTGENVSVESLLKFALSIRGWFSNKDSKANKENVRVGVQLLDELKPTVEFSMSNVNDGETLALYTVRGDGEALGVVANGKDVTINGKYLKLLEGDKVTAACGAETLDLALVGSEDDHVTATLPRDFAANAKDGDEVRFTVEGRCGDPEAGTQTKSIVATLRKVASADPTVPSGGAGGIV